MPADPRPDLAPAGLTPALTLAGLPAWADRLAAPDPLPSPGGAPAADAAGMQFLASALLWAPGRLRLDPADGSPAALLWHRLGLDDPADAEVVRDGPEVAALRRREGSRA